MRRRGKIFKSFKKKNLSQTCTEQLYHHHQRSKKKRRKKRQRWGATQHDFYTTLGFFDLKVMLLTGKKKRVSQSVCVTRRRFKMDGANRKEKKERNKGQIIHGPQFLSQSFSSFIFLFLVNSGGLRSLL